MSCEEVKGLVQDYVIRELDPDARRRMDEHLLGCEECRRELALMSAVISGLEAPPLEEPAPGFGSRVLAALPRRRAWSPSPYWVLVLGPVLLGVVWLLRQPLADSLVRALAWFGLDASRVAAPALTSVPVLTGTQVVMSAVAVGLAAVGFTITTAVFVWRRVSA